MSPKLNIPSTINKKVDMHLLHNVSFEPECSEFYNTEKWFVRFFFVRTFWFVFLLFIKMYFLSRRGHTPKSWVLLTPSLRRFQKLRGSGQPGSLDVCPMNVTARPWRLPSWSAVSSPIRSSELKGSTPMWRKQVKTTTSNWWSWFCWRYSAALEIKVIR